MKASIRRAAIAALFLLPMLGACGGGDDDEWQDEDLVGIWVADRITGDADLDRDQSTVVYNADGSGDIWSNEGPMDFLWETDDGTIITIIPEVPVEFESEYEFSDSKEQVRMTTFVEGREVTEIYHKVTDNHPAELVNNWRCTSVEINGVPGNCADVPNLNLQADGAGSVLWNVADDAFVWRDPLTQLGGVMTYTVNGNTLVMTEADDTGLTVTTYEGLVL